MIEFRKKKNVKEQCTFFFKVKKEHDVLFCNIYFYIYIYISLYIYNLYISLYICISVYIYVYTYIIYIEKKTRNILRSFEKNKTFSRSFMFFAKERNILCILLHSLQKNVAFFAFLSVLKKRMQKNASFFWVS